MQLIILFSQSCHLVFDNRAGHVAVAGFFFRISLIRLFLPFLFAFQFLEQSLNEGKSLDGEDSGQSIIIQFIFNIKEILLTNLEMWHIYFKLDATKYSNIKIIKSNLSICWQL
jgi:hypothetical protein